MLDFSWSELLVVIIVAILAIGPQQIPDVLYRIGRIVRRLQYMRFALSKQFEDFMEKSDLEEMRKISDQVRHGASKLPADLLDPQNGQAKLQEAESDISHHDSQNAMRSEGDEEEIPVVKGVPPIASFGNNGLASVEGSRPNAPVPESISKSLPKSPAKSPANSAAEFLPDPIIKPPKQ